LLARAARRPRCRHALLARPLSWGACVAAGGCPSARPQSGSPRRTIPPGGSAMRLTAALMASAAVGLAAAAAADKDSRVYELRTYTAAPGKLDALNARFRDHTLKLFEKHGMTNVAYWNYAKGVKGEDEMLVYLLAHKSPEAMKASWDAFRADPVWVKAKAETEAKAGGTLTTPYEEK